MIIRRGVSVYVCVRVSVSVCVNGAISQHLNIHKEGSECVCMYVCVCM